jgi:TonB family protein
MIRHWVLCALISLGLQGCMNSPQNEKYNPTKCLGPVYPKDALKAKEEGTVTMDLLISTTGVVKQSKILISSGYPELDNAAVEGLTKCHFKPLTYYNGTPIEGWKSMLYVWKIHHKVVEE